MSRILIVLSGLFALTVVSYGQSEQHPNSFATMLDLSANSTAERAMERLHDMSIEHTDVNGVRWRISRGGRSWQVIADDNNKTQADELVIESDGVARWKEESTQHRVATLYTLQGCLVGAMSGNDSGLDASHFRNTVVVVVVKTANRVSKQLLIIQ